jgi:hypothetical protein
LTMFVTSWVWKPIMDLLTRTCYDSPGLGSERPSVRVSQRHGDAAVRVSGIPLGTGFQVPIKKCLACVEKLLKCAQGHPRRKGTQRRDDRRQDSGGLGDRRERDTTPDRRTPPHSNINPNHPLRRISFGSDLTLSFAHCTR